mmetsp:Transcript_17997/g.55365  ORF Transcript_17997/g.55365 Transcript_17997/m.55365 type:complete len:367 (+) Transcript_17997:356-1456(+)
MSDFSSMRVADLRAECESRGLPSTGKKQDLVDRLSAVDGRSDHLDDVAKIAPSVSLMLTSALVLSALVQLGSSSARFGMHFGFHESLVDFYDACESHAFPIPFLTGAVLPAWLRFSTMDFFGSAICCCAYRRKLEATKKTMPWFLGLAACTVMQFGGTTLVGVLLGQPASWALSHNAPRALLLAYWLVWACPKDAFYKAHEGSIVVQLFFATGAALSAGHAVTSWGADKALNAMHAKPRSAVFTTLMAGAFGASGGGLSVVALDVWDEGADPDRAYGAFLFAAVGSTGYYLLRDPHGVLGLSGLAAPDARLVVGAYSLLSSAVPKIYAALGADVSAATPPRLVEAFVRFCLRLPARVGTAGKSKDD